jgi:hypothetical protein
LTAAQPAEASAEKRVIHSPPPIPPESTAAPSAPLEPEFAPPDGSAESLSHIDLIKFRQFSRAGRGDTGHTSRVNDLGRSSRGCSKQLERTLKLGLAKRRLTEMDGPMPGSVANVTEITYRQVFEIQ